MESYEEIFTRIAKKRNSEFNIQQFTKHNWLLYSSIINSMQEATQQKQKEINRLKKIISDDTDYKAMRNYAKELEAKLGIVTDSNK